MMSASDHHHTTQRSRKECGGRLLHATTIPKSDESDTYAKCMNALTAIPMSGCRKISGAIKTKGPQRWKRYGPVDEDDNYPEAFNGSETRWIYPLPGAKSADHTERTPVVELLPAAHGAGHHIDARCAEVGEVSV
jgi:hypothetical protein